MTTTTKRTARSLALISILSGFSGVTAASAGPLGGAGQQLRRQIAAQHQGISLTGGPVYQDPSWGWSTNSITSFQPPTTDMQKNAKQQSLPHVRAGASYSADAPPTSILDLSDPTSPPAWPPPAPPTDPNSGGTNYSSYSAQTFVQNDTWTIGSSWISATLAYFLRGDNAGNTFGYAESLGQVLGWPQVIAGLTVTSSRNYNGTETVSDDKLGYTVSSTILNQTTQIYNDSLPLGHRFTPIITGNNSDHFFENTFTTAIGPIPVAVTLWLGGSYFAGSPYFEFGLAPNSFTDIYYDARMTPSAALNGGGRVDIGALGQIPPEIRPGQVYGAADVQFLNFEINADIHGTSSGQGPCLSVGLSDLRALAVDIYGVVQWQLLQTQFVSEFVDDVCDNGFFTIPGCDQVRNVLHQVQSFLSFNITHHFYQSPGMSWPSQNWLDTPYCKNTVPQTTVWLCNQNGNRPVYAALMYYRPDTNNWETQGWWALDALSCKNVPLGNEQNPNLYVFGMNNLQDVWPGETTMCVDPVNKFLFPQQIGCFAPNQAVAGKHITITPNTNNIFNFEIKPPPPPPSRTVSFCNYTSHDPLYSAWVYDDNGVMRGQGWDYISKGQCVSHDVPASYSGPIYAYANDATRSAFWGRGFQFCADDVNGFNWTGVDTMSCSGGSATLKQFTRYEAFQNVVYQDKDALVGRRVCNQNSDEMYVAAAYAEHQDSGLTLYGTLGWFPVPAGQCNELRRQRADDYLWFYAMANGREFPVQTPNGFDFCVNPTSAFSLNETPSTCPNGMVKKYMTSVQGTYNVTF
jgi:uncharacterized membrane protein